MASDGAISLPGGSLTTRRWLLVPSTLLGSESWVDVAAVLTRLGQTVFIAEPQRQHCEMDDFITGWVSDVLDALPPPPSPQESLDQDAPPLVVVGHSAACPRLFLVAEGAIVRGHNVSTVILANGRLPEDGMAATEVDPTLTLMLDRLTRPDGHLPPWHRWWGSMVEDMLPVEADRVRVFSQARPVPRKMFDQKIAAPQLPDDVGLAFLAMGSMYTHAYDEAKARDWAVARLEGEHLHQVVNPMAVGCTLMALASQARRTV